MTPLSSISVVTTADDEILLSASGFKVDPLRVMLMTEADYCDAMRAIADGEDVTCKSWSMPLLSSDRPTISLKVPSAGKWRIVYQTADADYVTAKVTGAKKPA